MSTPTRPVLKSTDSVSSGLAAHIVQQVSTAQATELEYLTKILLPDQVKPLILHLENSRKQLEENLRSHIAEKEEEVETDEVKKAKALGAAAELLKPDELQRLTQALRSSDRAAQKWAVKGFLTLLGVCKWYKTPLERLQVAEQFVKIFETLNVLDILPPLFNLLQVVEDPDLQTDVLELIAFYTPGPRIAFTPRDSYLHPDRMEFKRRIIVDGGVPILVQLCNSSNQVQVQVAALNVLVAIAKHNVEARDFLIQQGVLVNLINLINRTEKDSVLVACTNLLAILTKSPQLIQASGVIIPCLSAKLQSTATGVNVNVDILCNVLHCLGNGNLPLGIEPRLCRHIVEMTGHSSTRVQEAALETIDCIIKSNPGLLGVLLDVLFEAIMKIDWKKNHKIGLKVLTTLSSLAQIPNALSAMLNAHMHSTGSGSHGNVLNSLGSILVDGDAKMELRIKAMEVIAHISNGDESSIINLCTATFVGICVGFLRRFWRLNSASTKTPIYNLTLTRNVLQIISNILLPRGRDVPVSSMALLFDEDSINIILSLMLEIASNKSPAVMMYRSEFIGKFYVIFERLHVSYKSIHNANFEGSVHLRRYMEHVMSLIETIVEGIAGAGAGAGAGTKLGTASTVTVKCYFRNNDNRLLDIDTSVSFEDLKRRISQIYNVAEVTLQYRDQEGDMITIATQPAMEKWLQLAQQTFASSNSLSLFQSQSQSQSSSHSTSPTLKLMVREGNVNTSMNMSMNMNMNEDQAMSRARAMTVSNEYTQLQDLVMREVKLEEPHIAKLFEFWSTKADRGIITKDDMEVGFQSFLNIRDPTIIEAAYKAFDVDGDGKLDMRECVMGMSSLRHGSLDEKLFLSFRVYDVDRSGYISRDEIRAILYNAMRRQSGVNGGVDEEMLDSVVDHLFELVDQNKDGQLSFEEFKSGVLDGHITGVFGF